MAQKRKHFRSNYWAPIIDREISIVLAIAWYIGVQLLRTKQLPPYISHTGINRVPALMADIQKQAASVYTELFRKDDIVNKFYVADTGDKYLDGKVGLITSYHSVKCCFATKIEGAHQMKNSNLFLSTANMEPFKRVYTPTHVPHPSKDTCIIRLGNHFPHFNHVSPCVTFYADIFSEIGGITASPHTGGQAQRDRLVELIEMKELMRHTDAEKIQSQQTELKRGLSKLCVIDSSVEGHPEKKLQQTSKCRHVSANKRQINYMALEMKSACKAKIEHIVTRAHGSEEVNRDENGVHEHMFTYPFKTVDNSLHQCCAGLPEFSHYVRREGLNNAVYGTNNIASFIVIDRNSVSSVTPGHQMDDNIMNFCLSW